MKTAFWGKSCLYCLRRFSHSNVHIAGHFCPRHLCVILPKIFFLLTRQRVRDRHATLAEVLATNDGIVDGECGTSLLPKAKYVWFTKES